MMNTRIPFADITDIVNDPVTGYLPPTPFPSPEMSQAMLQPHPAAAQMIQNYATPFYALRRMSSYSTNIAAAVANLFDRIPITLGLYRESDTPRNRRRRFLEHEILRCISHDYLACNAASVNSSHLLLTLSPFLE